MNDQTVIKTIDVTPTWESIVEVLMLALTNGTENGREIAREELRRMAKIADKFVAIQKAAK